MIDLARPGKHSLTVENPVLIASGMMGFEPSSYKDLLKLEKFGAMVTAPLSWKPRGPSRGTRAVPLASGLLLHTGLPNNGVRKVVKQYRSAWRSSPIPIIAHLIDSNADMLFSSARAFEGIENVVGIELGIHENAGVDDLAMLVDAARQGCELPLLVKLPLFSAPWMAPIAEKAGADGLVIASSPRGTERDPLSGQMVGGRLYGPFLKPMVQRAIGQISTYVSIPITGCGGIHHSNDGRDFLEAGASAVQVDTLLWVAPNEAEIVARNLGGLEYTRAIGALDDEWEPGFGKTQMMKRQPSAVKEAPPDPPPPPEMPDDEDPSSSTLSEEDWY